MRKRVAPAQRMVGSPIRAPRLPDGTDDNYDVRIDPLAIVTDAQPDLVVVAAELDLDLSRMPVPKWG